MYKLPFGADHARDPTADTGCWRIPGRDANIPTENCRKINCLPGKRPTLVMNRHSPFHGGDTMHCPNFVNGHELRDPIAKLQSAPCLQLRSQSAGALSGCHWRTSTASRCRWLQTKESTHKHAPLEARAIKRVFPDS